MSGSPALWATQIAASLVNSALRLPRPWVAAERKVAQAGTIRSAHPGIPRRSVPRPCRRARGRPARACPRHPCRGRRRSASRSCFRPHTCAHASGGGLAWRRTTAAAGPRPGSQGRIGGIQVAAAPGDCQSGLCGCDQPRDAVVQFGRGLQRPHAGFRRHALRAPLRPRIPNPWPGASCELPMDPARPTRLVGSLEMPFAGGGDRGRRSGEAARSRRQHADPIRHDAGLPSELDAGGAEPGCGAGHAAAAARSAASNRSRARYTGTGS